MKISASVVRFLLEAALIIAVAVASAVARLDKVWIALAVGGAWVAVTVVERAAKQEQRRGLGATLASIRPARRAPAATPEHPPEPPRPEPAPEPAPPAPDPEPPRPEPEQPTPQLQAVPPPAPEPEPEPAREPEREVVALRPRSAGVAREWNVWELERIAREQEGADPARDEELNFLLLELRQFANADGQLPASFDPVVRDAFGDAIYSSV